MGKHGKAMSGDINTPGWQIRKVHPPMAAIWWVDCYIAMERSIMLFIER
jgi:hypothetical protein